MRKNIFKQQMKKENFIKSTSLMILKIRLYFLCQIITLFKRCCMKMYLLQDVLKVGFAGEIIKVSDGYAKNFLIPKKLAKLAQEQALKQSIVERRKVRLAPTLILMRKLVITLAITVLLLYLGRFVNIHLAGIIRRILEKS